MYCIIVRDERLVEATVYSPSRNATYYFSIKGFRVYKTLNIILSPNNPALLSLCTLAFTKFRSHSIKRHIRVKEKDK